MNASSRLFGLLAGLVACLWGWTAAYAAVLSGEVALWAAGQGPMPAAVLLYPLGASFAALVLAFAPGGGGFASLALRLGTWASLKAWAFGLGLAVLATVFAHLIGQGDPSGARRAAMLAGSNVVGLMSNPHDVMVLLVMQAVLFSLLFGALFMLTEEVLWRGALAARWAKLSPLRRGLLTGLLQGLWSVPLVGMGALGHAPQSWLGPILWVGVSVAMGPILEHVRQGSRSVLGPALLRAGFVGIAGALSLTLTPVNPAAGDLATSWAGAYGLGGILVCAALSFWLFRSALRPPKSSV
jgi:hypothetical protein